MNKMVESAMAGDLRAMARIISLIENESPQTDEIMKSVYPHTGRAVVIGVTGSPGAGKSTLVDKLITRYRQQGKNVGIIAVDPSSPFSGGAILGDRLRMQDHALENNVYIRSMGARGSLGGVSSCTHEAALVLDACGRDVIIIETVGVGQSEVDIVKIADTVCLVLVPGMGDDVQIMKAGIMEIADVFLINKADKDGADKVVADVRMMLDMSVPKEWTPPAVKTSADRDMGIDEAVAAITSHGEYLKSTAEGHARRESRARMEVEGIIRRSIARRAAHAWEDRKSAGVVDDLLNRRIDPYTLAGEIMNS